jgi:hypothetical protein
MPSAVSFVIGYRYRDLLRVVRCLDSLACQTFRDFDLTLLEYGSVSETPRAMAAFDYPVEEGDG